MAYYDKIAGKWHQVTGYHGGAFKELILNERVISKIGEISSKTILEIGIGNGYFMPMLLKRKSGQIPDRILLTDVSKKNLQIAEKEFRVHGSEYQVLDIYRQFPIEESTIDLVISNMVFNEVKFKGLKNGLSEIGRVLRDNGSVVISVLHPDFISKQIERGVIKGGMLPTRGGLKVPVNSITLSMYKELLDDFGFDVEIEEVFGNEKLYNVKPRLKEIRDIPIGMIICGSVRK